MTIGAAVCLRRSSGVQKVVLKQVSTAPRPFREVFGVAPTLDRAHSNLSVPSRFGEPSPAAGAACGRQIDGEDAALPLHALDLEGAAVAVEDVLDDGETESGAAQLARAGRVDPVEPLRQAREVLARDTLAAVHHGDGDRRTIEEPRRTLLGDRPLWGRIHRPAGDADGRSRAAVFDGIVDQV